MRASLVMFISNKKLALVCFLLLTFTAPGVIAQTTNSLEEGLTLTGESLQGIPTPRIEASFNNQRTPKLDIMFEPEQKTSGHGDVLFEGLIDQQKPDNSPIYTINKINTNQGDGSSSRQATIPFAHF